VIEGRGPSPALVIKLIERLPDTSLTAALASGGREHIGWGLDRYMLAALYDALNANTRATGNWGKGKVPKFQEWPRPNAKSKSKGKGKDPTKKVRDLYAHFIRR
jgi:hypothetical protein